MLSGLDTKQYFGHRKKVSAVTWNLDGTRLAAAGDQGSSILIWNTETMEANNRPESNHLHECRGHTDNIEVLLGSPTSEHIFASAGVDCCFNAYDTRTGRDPMFSVTLDSPCLFGAWTPDGNAIAIGSSSNNLYIIDSLSQKITKTLPFDHEVNQFCWSIDGKWLFIATGQGTVDVMEWPSMKKYWTLGKHMRACMGVARDPKDKFIAVTSMDTMVSVWDAQTLSNIHTIDRFRTPVHIAEYSCDGEFLALAGDSPGIEINEASSGILRHTIPTTSSINYMAWHPKKPLLAYTPNAPKYPSSDFQPPTCVWGFSRS